MPITAKEIERLAKQPGIHLVDPGLYLQVKGSSCSWLHRYSLKGKKRWSGLGPYPGVTAAEARKRLGIERARILAGVDPVEERRRERAEATAERRQATFRDVAKNYIVNHESHWTPKYRAEWITSLQRYAYAIIGDLDVAAITTEDVRQVLQPIWYTKRSTASLVRGRIEAILSFAKPLGLRSGENAARWADNLKHVFPKREKKRKQHHAALPYEDLPSFLVELRKHDGVAAKALEFVILTAVRVGDVIGQRREEKPPMLWAHVDLNARVWTIPNTKNGTEHRVPLSPAAIAVLDRMKDIGFDTEIVFPSFDRRGQSLSDNAFLNLLDRMHYRDRTTVHGFRSTFRDWAGECTNFPRELAEKALCHTVGDETERAYQRGDLLNKRRLLMEAWSTYCSPATEDNVVPLRKSNSCG